MVWVWTGREDERSVTSKGLWPQLQWSWPHHPKQGPWSRTTRSSWERPMLSPHPSPDLLNQNLWGWVPVFTAVQEVVIGSKVWEVALLWRTGICDVRGDDLPVHWITHNFKIDDYGVYGYYRKIRKSGGVQKVKKNAYVLLGTVFQRNRTNRFYTHTHTHIFAHICWLMPGLYRWRIMLWKLLSPKSAV